MKTDAELISILSSTIGMQDFSTAINLCHLLMRCESVPGQVVEMGCHRGLTARMLAAITTKTLYLYDSFDGLPDETKADAGKRGGYKRGALKSNLEDVLRHFADYELQIPIITKGWINTVSINSLPDLIAFAHLDVDFYESTMDALMLVYERLSPGAMCVIHDYGWDGLPGVKLAVDEFLFNKPEKIVLLPAVPWVVSKQVYFTKL